GVLDLPQDRGDDLLPGGEQARVGRGHVVPHNLVQAGQRVVGNQREHVVLRVVVHVPVQEAVDGVHVHRPAVQAVIKDVLGQARVLREPVDGRQPRAVEVCEADVEEGQDAAGVERQAYHGGVDEDVDAGLGVDLGELALGDE